jgi:hypothetical protein
MQFSQTEIQHVAFADRAEIERNAYNAAFCELGLRWRWDSDAYRELLRIPDEMQRISAYLQTHQSNLLRAYGTDFLGTLIHATKQRCQDAADPFAPAGNAFDDVH